MVGFLNHLGQVKCCRPYLRGMPAHTHTATPKPKKPPIRKTARRKAPERYFVPKECVEPMGSSYEVRPAGGRWQVWRTTWRGVVLLPMVEQVSEHATEAQAEQWVLAIVDEGLEPEADCDANLASPSSPGCSPPALESPSGCNPPPD